MLAFGGRPFPIHIYQIWPRKFLAYLSAMADDWPGRFTGLLYRETPPILRSLFLT